jgi:hypothetical protein
MLVAARTSKVEVLCEKGLFLALRAKIPVGARSDQVERESTLRMKEVQWEWRLSKAAAS